jgi:hypothetical protein
VRPRRSYRTAVLSYRVFMQGHRFFVEVTHPSGTRSIGGVFDSKEAADAWVAAQLVEAEKRGLRRPATC